MSHSPDEEDEEFVPITFEEAADEFTEMSEEKGTLPDGSDTDENIEWCTEQMEYAHEAVEIEEHMAADNEHWDNIERQDAYENSNDSDSSVDDFNPDEENWEAEDMPGDNADERAEAHDNWDNDAADG
jgi:hypothetical protein